MLWRLEHLVNGGREGGVLAEDEHDDEEHVHVAGRAARRVVQLAQQRHQQRVQIAAHHRVRLRTNHAADVRSVHMQSQ